MYYFSVYLKIYSWWWFVVITWKLSYHWLLWAGFDSRSIGRKIDTFNSTELQRTLWEWQSFATEQNIEINRNSSKGDDKLGSSSCWILLYPLCNFFLSMHITLWNEEKMWKEEAIIHLTVKGLINIKLSIIKAEWSCSKFQNFASLSPQSSK